MKTKSDLEIIEMIEKYALKNKPVNPDPFKSFS
jgi:hypothetical protein